MHISDHTHLLNILSTSDRYVIWWLYNAGLKIGTMEQDMFICLPHEDCNMPGSRRQTMHNKKYTQTHCIDKLCAIFKKKYAFNYFTLISFIHFWLHSHSSSISLSVIIFILYMHTQNHKNILEMRIINQIFSILFP